MNSYRRRVFLWLLLPLLVFLSACGQNPVDPEGFTEETRGCGDFLIYKLNSNRTDVVVVDAAASDLVFDRTPRQFALPNTALDVRIDRFSGPALMRYCIGNDIDNTVDGNPKLVRSWRAVSGTVRITAGDTLGLPQAGSVPYKVSVVLRDAIFRDNYGDEVFIKELDFGEVTVGWLAI